MENIIYKCKNYIYKSEYICNKFFHKIFNNIILAQHKKPVKENKKDIEKAYQYVNSLRYHNIDYKKITNKFEPTYDLMIVLPVYNSEKTIKKCIESVINQDTNYSFILKVIDDGSTDSTAKIIDKYRNNKNIMIIHQENKGRSEARNKGLENINGKYVMFIDSDDYIENGCIQKLLDEAFKKNCDIVEGKIRVKKGKNSYVYQNGGVTGYPFAKVYRGEIFIDKIFLPKFEFEDTLNYFLIYPQYDKKEIINEIVYNYCINDNGITKKSLFSNISVDTYLITEYYVDYIIKNNIYDKQKLLNLFLNQIFVNASRVRYLNKKVKKSIFVLTKNLYDNNFKDMKQNELSDLQSLLIRSFELNDYTLYNHICILAK